METASRPSVSASSIAVRTIAARVSDPSAGAAGSGGTGSSHASSGARLGMLGHDDTVYGVSDTPYGDERRATFTPRLIRLSAVVILGVIMTILDTTIVNVAIHTLGRDFHASVATIQWVAT